MYAVATLGALFCKLGIATDKIPAANAIFRPHLPRPRILRALLEDAFIKWGRFESPSTAFFTMGPIDLSMHMNYDSFSRLERAVQLEGECGKRGCIQPAQARCSQCQMVYYCGAVCQTRSVPVELDSASSY